MSSGGPDLSEFPSRNLAYAKMLLAFAAVGLVFSLVYLYSTPFVPLPNSTPVGQSTFATSLSDTTVPASEPPVLYLDTEVAEFQTELLALQGKLGEVRDDLQQLQDLQTAWQPLSQSLLTGDQGQKVAGSPKHVGLIREALSSQGVSTRQRLQWEQQLEALEEPLDQASQYGRKVHRISTDYQNKIDELRQAVTKALTHVQQRDRIVSAVLQETESLPATDVSLEEALEELEQQLEREFVERLTKARTDARRRAEESQIATVARMEAEVVAAEEKRQAAKLQAEKDRVAALAKEEEEQRKAEQKIRAAQQQATLAGLEIEATRVEEALEKAQLEREFQRDLPLIQSHLIAFTAPGFGRRDGGQGPVSWAYLQGRGVLVQSQAGYQRLAEQAGGSNDRPRGAIPENLTQSAWPILEQAQSLLRKYGPLMVEKGMLDP